jgi:hypothetical protein
MFQVYAIIENGRCAQRSLVYSSDSYLSLRHFEAKTSDRVTPFVTNGQRAAGNFFGSLFTKVFSD